MTLCNTLFLRTGYWYRSVSAFTVTINIAPINSQLPKGTQARVITLIYHLFEFNLLRAVEKSYKYHLKNLLDPIDKTGCLYKTSLRARDTYEFYAFKSLILDNYIKSLIYFGIGLSISMIVFMFECLSNLTMESLFI